MGVLVWQKVLRSLEYELSSQQFSTWIRPLQVESSSSSVTLLAPNKYIQDGVCKHFLNRIKELVQENGLVGVELLVGSLSSRKNPMPQEPLTSPKSFLNNRPNPHEFYPILDLNKDYTFDTFVKGSSNEFARAAAFQLSENSDGKFKCLLIYGGVGLGKTHLMHAVGNAVLVKNPHLKVAYMYSQRFMEDMVRAIARGAMSEFTDYYRSVDVLLMDDIQFLANRTKSQEEFFHVFNRLHENGSQIVLTCDRYPKEIDGLEERLKSRFVWGMTAPVEPPELETRVAILLKKAESENADLPHEVAFFIAEKIRSNVRELEGALTSVIADAKFTRRDIGIKQVKEALKHILAIQDRQVGIENIQKLVADYYKIRVADMHTKKRTRSVARPRQVAMALARELTNHSLPEIGDSFGGRDHATVIHACRRIEELKESHRDIREDYNNLLRLLTN